MPSAGNIITGTAGSAAQGAAIGSMFGPGPGTLIGGAIGGFVGLLGSIFGGGESPEEIMKRRKIEAQKAVAAAYAKKRADLATDTKSTIARAEQGAARRALSTGRSATAGDIAGATGQVYAEGGRALRGLQEAEAEQLASIEAGYAARPIEEDMPLSDVLMSLGSSVANFAMLNKQVQTLDAQKAAADKMATMTIKPVETAVDVSGGSGKTEFAPLYQPGQEVAQPVSYVPGKESAVAPITQLEQIYGEGVGNVNDALTNPNAQGFQGARQGAANRMYNNSRAKYPGGTNSTYNTLIRTVTGRNV